MDKDVACKAGERTGPKLEIKESRENERYIGKVNGICKMEKIKI